MRKASEPRGEKSETLRATFEVPRDLADRFREVAKRNERTFSAELRALMSQHIEKEVA